MYTINVKRGKTDGMLSYHGGVVVNTKCWWDPAKKIPTGMYSGCSATTMASKRNSMGNPREAIFLPNVAGFTGIFMHMGTSAAWSDGCIVIAEREVKKIWDDIDPKNGRNVTIIVSDG